MQHYPSKDSMDAERIQLLEEMAFQHGRYFDSYLITEPAREYLWGSEDYGVIGFSRKGRYLHVAGGLICNEYHRTEFLEEIREFAKLNKLVISFFSIDEADAESFRAAGFQVSRFGVDSQLELDGLEWRGKPYEWVRRQSNYVSRQAVTFEEGAWGLHSAEDQSALYEELRIISEEHLAGKAQNGEIPFFEGQLVPGHMHRRRLFLARGDNGAGRIEGFLICNPMQGGEGWSIEMYRQRTEAPRGTIPYLFKQVIDQLKSEGVERVSICPVPTIGTERELPGSAFPVRAGMYVWRKLGSIIFDCKGLYHFKSRFRPQFQDLFICAYPRSNWGAVWAYLMTIKSFDVKWGAVLKKLFSFNRQRRTLVDPKLPAPQVQPEAAPQARGDVLEFSAKQTGSPASKDAEEPAGMKRVS